MSETYLTDHTEKLYRLKDYNFYRTNVSNNKGGVCLYVSNRIVSKFRADISIKTDHLETVFAECLFDNHTITVGVIYHRPGTNMRLFQNDLTDMLHKIKNRCILMGHFNVNILNESIDNNVSNFVSDLREFAYLIE